MIHHDFHFFLYVWGWWPGRPMSLVDGVGLGVVARTPHVSGGWGWFGGGGPDAPCLWWMGLVYPGLNRFLRQQASVQTHAKTRCAKRFDNYEKCV